MTLGWNWSLGLSAPEPTILTAKVQARIFRLEEEMAGREADVGGFSKKATKKQNQRQTRGVMARLIPEVIGFRWLEVRILFGALCLASGWAAYLSHMTPSYMTCSAACWEGVECGATLPSWPDSVLHPWQGRTYPELFG